MIEVICWTDSISVFSCSVGPYLYHSNKDPALRNHRHPSIHVSYRAIPMSLQPHLTSAVRTVPVHAFVRFHQGYITLLLHGTVASTLDSPSKDNEHYRERRFSQVSQIVGVPQSSINHNTARGLDSDSTRFAIASRLLKNATLACLTTFPRYPHRRNRHRDK